MKSGVRSPLDSLDGQNMVIRDDIARHHCARIIEEYINQQNIASLLLSSLLRDLNSIEHMWDKLGFKLETSRIKVSKGAKIRIDTIKYNQIPHLTQDTNGKVTNS